MATKQLYVLSVFGILSTLKVTVAPESSLTPSPLFESKTRELCVSSRILISKI